MEEEKEEEVGTSFWKARNFRPLDLPAYPEPPAPGVQARPERANSLDSLKPGRNLPGTSGLPACKDSGRSPCNLFPTYPFVA